MRRGLIAWFARTPVAANLLLFLLAVGGVIVGPRIVQEVFPEVTERMVTVEVAYPGASPEEVEQGVLLPVEDVVRGLDGVKDVRSVAAEGLGIVVVELTLSADPQQLLNDVQSAVGRIASWPRDAEPAVVSLADTRLQVISLILYGVAAETSLRELAEQTREALIEDPRISYAEVADPRGLEIGVEVPVEAMRRYGLTLPAIAERIGASAVEVPAGDIEGAEGQVLVRTAARKEWADEIGDVIIVAGPSGSVVRLRDIAEIADELADTDERAFYQGLPAIRVDVFRVGGETPPEIAEAVRQHVERARRTLPEGVSIAAWGDSSVIFRDRVELLLRNGYLGLLLVLVLLGLFLSPRLAFWVTLGIPVSFLGALLFMPVFDVTINLISLFAFIVTLGLVVDDAIVVGESVQYEREQGVPREQAAAHGARVVAIPVLLAVSTTCVAFAPMLFVPGTAGELFRNIPVVVILVLLASLVESLLIVPAHLAHPMPRPLEFLLRPFFWAMDKLGSERITRGLDEFVERTYVPAVRVALRWRYLTVAIALTLLLGTLGLWLGGRIGFVFLPRIEGDEVSVALELPVGTLPEETRAVTERVEAAVRRAAARTPEGRDVIRGIYTEIGSARGQVTEGAFTTGGHLAVVRVDLGPAGERTTTSAGFVQRWREALGPLPEASSLVFEYTAGATAGPDLDLEVSHPDAEVRDAAAVALAAAVRRFAGVRDVDAGVEAGKEQLDVDLSPRGRALGLTEADLAAQLRGALFGAEALRQQRGRHEVRVYVRLPEEERTSVAHVEELVLRTPEGGEALLADVANVQRTRADTAIQRLRGRRVVHVTANVVGDTNANEVVGAVTRDVVPELEARWPELRVEAGGAQENQREALSNLGAGFAVALAVMFAILALAFRSYAQPLVVMVAIPLGAIGAIVGHLVLGYELSLSSVMGLVALAGVVVNDSLLLVTTINERRRNGEPLDEAVVGAGVRRFRPILLTSLTTFFGLAPMIFETSVQARFLVPMAIALGFGVLLSTPLIVLVVPCLYRILMDFLAWSRRGLDRAFGARTEHAAS